MNVIEAKNGMRNLAAKAKDTVGDDTVNVGVSGLVVAQHPQRRGNASQALSSRKRPCGF